MARTNRQKREADNIWTDGYFSFVPNEPCDNPYESEDYQAPGYYFKRGWSKAKEKHMRTLND